MEPMRKRATPDRSGPVGSYVRLRASDYFTTTVNSMGVAPS